MEKILDFIKRIFNRNYNFDKLTGEELNSVVNKIIKKIKEEKSNELF